MNNNIRSDEELEREEPDEATPAAIKIIIDTSINIAGDREMQSPWPTTPSPLVNLLMPTT